MRAIRLSTYAAALVLAMKLDHFPRTDDRCIRNEKTEHDRREHGKRKQVPVHGRPTRTREP
jgi:hypothetical protein